MSQPTPAIPSPPPSPSPPPPAESYDAHNIQISSASCGEEEKSGEGGGEENDEVKKWRELGEKSEGLDREGSEGTELRKTLLMRRTAELATFQELIREQRGLLKEDRTAFQDEECMLPEPALPIHISVETDVTSRTPQARGRIRSTEYGISSASESGANKNTEMKYHRPYDHERACGKGYIDNPEEKKEERETQSDGESSGSRELIFALSRSPSPSQFPPDHSNSRSPIPTKFTKEIR
ncbi:hypothetical protein NHQ30_007995 [Ciborinia camelliae]|nr:hypothetical protein NHQ30_007995 [Ciborinia camelliae]